MEQMGITSAELLQDTLRNTHIENPGQKQEDWLRYIANSLEYVHSNYDIKSSDHMEIEFYKWIERIDCDDRKIMTPLADWVEFCKDRNKESRKDNERATKLKERGNAFFREKNYRNSAEKYTDSARYSTSDGDNFSTAIANRSAAFFHMDRYKESLQDIELAIKTGYSKGMLWKLYMRAAKCHLKLQRAELAEDWLAKLLMTVEHSDDMTETMKETIMKQANDFLLVVGESKKKNEDLALSSATKTQPVAEDMLEANSTYPYASRSVVRKRSPTRGRYVVAEQPIKKGDVLFAEKPFAWVPNEEEKNFSRCAHCCGPINDALVPCRGCLDTSYCNSKCWDKSWSYHQWECPGYHLAIWHQSSIFHLGFKIFLMSLTTTDKVSFNSVQSLMTNAEKKSTDVFILLAAVSLQLITYLELCTNFFDTVDLKECHVDKFTDSRMSLDFDITTKTGKQLYVGSMILRHTLQMNCNAYAISWLDKSNWCKKIGNFEDEWNRVGSGLYPSASMLSHSCDPTGKPSSWNNWLIIKAVKDIRQGEEISITYGPTFWRLTKAERQIWLRDRYYFDCQCTACANPLFDNYSERFYGLKCPKCSGPSKRLADSDSHRCLDCDATGKITCDNALKRADELYEKAMDFADIRKWNETISCLGKCLTIREKHLYMHNEDVAFTLTALKTAYTKIGDWRKSVFYLEKTLAAVEARYGSDSIEVAKQLNETSYILFQCLQTYGPLLGPSSQEQRDLFLKAREYADRALEIVSFICGPWSDRYRSINDTREQLFVVAKILGYKLL